MTLALDMGNFGSMVSIIRIFKKYFSAYICLAFFFFNLVISAYLVATGSRGVTCSQSTNLRTWIAKQLFPKNGWALWSPGLGDFSLRLEDWLNVAHMPILLVGGGGEGRIVSVTQNAWKASPRKERVPILEEMGKKIRPTVWIFS